MRLWSAGWAIPLILAACQTDKKAQKVQHRSEMQVQVQVQHPERKDVPIIKEGVGYAQGWYSATIRSQVDGTLDTVLFSEGQSVAAGEPLAQIDPRPFKIAVAQAEATLRRDIAQRDNARLNLQRSHGLLGDKLISAQAVADLAASAREMEASVAADQATLDGAKLQLERATIRAPFAGRLGLRQIDPGNLIRAQDANGLVLLTALDPMALIFTLPEVALHDVVAAMAKGPVKVEAFDQPHGQVVARGALSVLDNQINNASGTIRLKAALPNPSTSLWPNQFLRARLTVGCYRDALTLPARAINRGPRGDHVWIVDEQQSAVLRHVEVTAMVDGVAVMASGVAKSDLVITDGQFRLVQGSKVQITEPQRASSEEEALDADGQPQP